jgi:hypothetical protein
MAKVREERPATFAEYVGLIEDLQANSSNTRWYRGCARSTHRLLPSLYRHKTITAITELGRLENKLMTRFRQRSIPMHSRSLQDDWDALYFMQHYRVPTRLLDWTENPFVGLYFAVISCLQSSNARRPRTPHYDAAVWILDPAAWNRKALSHQSYDGEVLTPRDESLKGYKPSSSFAGMFNHPVALYGAHNSPRIVAQRGVFTIFGQNTKPMEEVYVKENFPPNCLIKITLKRARLASFRKSLLNYDITESVIFPDLEGLAEEIKRTFGFEV